MDICNAWRIAAICASLSIVSGCVSSTPSQPRELFSIPITGQFDNGIAAFGQATAMSDGRGFFWVKVPSGARCEGNYSVRDTNPTLIVPVSCNDGAKGEAVISRQPGLMSGSAIVALDNGRRAQMVFGNLRFDQVYGSGGTAKTM